MSFSALLLASVAARNNELVGGLVVAGLLAFGREAPRRDRVAAARRAAFAAAVRVVDRIHGDAAVMRPPAHPTLAPGLADRNVHVVRIRNRANGRHAAAVHKPLLARIEAQNHVLLVAADDLGIGAGRARQLAALSDLE